MRVIIIIGFIFTLIGCSHEITLQSLDGQQIGKATLEFENNNSGTIHLVRSGMIYQGQWTAVKVDESREIAEQYGMGRKKYQNYLQGKGNYLMSAQSTLISKDGDTLNCEFMYRGVTAHGWCSSETETFEFVVKS